MNRIILAHTSCYTFKTIMTDQVFASQTYWSKTMSYHKRTINLVTKDR